MNLPTDKMVRVFAFIILFVATKIALQAQANIDTLSFKEALSQVNIGPTNVVVIGEHHYINNTFSTEFFIIEKLAEKGYRNIYIEGGHSEAAILNLYMQTGDTSLLKYTRARGEKYRKALEDFYTKSKTNHQEFTFKGFDFERPLCAGYLFNKWFNHDSTSQLKNIGAYLLSIDSKPADNLAEVEQRGTKMKVLLDSIKATFNENYYKKILREEYSIFHSIIYNPIYADFKKTGLHEKRDPYFVKFMLDEEKQNSIGQSIIITGISHMVDEGRFISALSDSLIGKYSVTGFLFVYKDCTDFDVDRLYNSPKSHLKYLTKANEENPRINFAPINYIAIPTKNDEVISIAVGMYRQ